jgi:hypothetical protein
MNRKLPFKTCMSVSGKTMSEYHLHPQGTTFSYYEIEEYEFGSLVRIESVASLFLRFVPREMPGFPSHGTDHSITIINLINDFHKSWDANFSHTELFFLYAAAWLHDIGCVKSRKNHSKHSSEIIRNNHTLRQAFQEVDRQGLEIIKYIVQAHSRSYPIDTIPNILGENVRVKLLSAVFRIIDACEIHDLKCPMDVYLAIKDDLDEEAIKYWEEHLKINSVNLSCPRIRIDCKSRIPDDNNLLTNLEAEILSVKKIFQYEKLQIPTIVCDPFVDVV